MPVNTMSPASVPRTSRGAIVNWSQIPYAGDAKAMNVATWRAVRPRNSVRHQKLECAGDESQTRQRRRDLLACVGEVADQVDNWSNVHFFDPLFRVSIQWRRNSSVLSLLQLQRHRPAR
jgi:hypothetical protein